MSGLHGHRYYTYDLALALSTTAHGDVVRTGIHAGRRRYRDALVTDAPGWLAAIRRHRGWRALNDLIPRCVGGCKVEAR